MTANLKFGLVLPHFGQHASTKKCLEGSIQAEAYGFDSVWVRDHLVFTPYAMEGTDNTHIEGLLILSAVAAVTRKLTLGTAMTICHRNPIHLAQCFAALSRIADGRVIMAWAWAASPMNLRRRGCQARRPSVHTWPKSMRTFAEGCGRAREFLTKTAITTSRT